MPLDLRTRVPEDGARAALALLALVAGILPELDQVDGGGAELAGASASASAPSVGAAPSSRSSSSSLATCPSSAR
ncbi:hypothetical protein WMF38_39635 [Sorangium sp. So ce118]